MDEAQLYELLDLYKLIPWANVISYEQMRYVAWAAFKPTKHKKIMEPQKWMPFTTDKGSIYVERDEEPKPLGEEQIVSMRNMILKQYNRKRDDK